MNPGNEISRTRWTTLFLIVMFAVVMAPGLPTVSVMAANVTFTWNPNTESDLAGYKVYWGDATRAYAAHVDVPAAAGEVKTATIDVQPEDGRTVYFAATAYDSAGNESGYSNEATWQVPDHTAPGTPQNFQLTVQLTLEPDGRLSMSLAQVQRMEQ